MKQLTPNVYMKHAITLTLLIILSMVIWFSTPLLSMMHLQPIQLEKKLYVIALLFLVWVLKLIFTPFTKNKTNAIPNTPEALKKLRILDGRFQGAMHFLKKTIINKHDKNINLLELPWCLFIGPSETGKTTLLANANISYLLRKQVDQEKINTSDSCDFWATQDVVIIDMPGTYLKSNEEFLWEHSLDLIKKYRGSKALHAVTILLPLPELLKQDNASQKNTFILGLQKKIQHLHKQFGKKLNFYFIITKCDHIPGFLEFFNDCSAEESAQAWGITLPLRKDNESLLDVFTRRFNTLIKRLNNQLIWRLHQERNPTIRPAIKDFPLHIEHLKEAIHYFLRTLSTPELHLQGIYLTSATQSHSEQPTFPHIINHSSQQVLPYQRHSITLTKPYFIRQLMLQGMLSTANPLSSSTSRSRRQNVAIYTASIGSVITATLLLGYDFQRNLLRTYAIHNDITQYQLAIRHSDQASDHIVKALPLLNELQVAAHSHSTSRIADFLPTYSDKSKNTAAIIYQQSLQILFLSEIKHMFEQYLQDNTNKNPALSYAVLKSYIMLKDPKNLNSDYILHTFETVLSIPLNNITRRDFISHLNTALLHEPNSIMLNKALITATRNALLQLPHQELAQIILKNMDIPIINKDIHLDINTSNTLFATNNSAINHVPALFTAAAFQIVYSQAISNAATESLQGNWIIGAPKSLSNSATINELAENVRANYITNYVETWENIVTHLKLTDPINLTQTDAMLTSFISDTSPLLKALHTIKANTSLEPILAKSVKLQAINTLLTNENSDQENMLYQVFVNLRQLHFYLQPFVNAHDMGQSAFETATARIQDGNDENPITNLYLFAEKTPEPIKTWLNQLATHSWHFILQETSLYIENAWQVNILTIYHSQIANLFPFSQKSDQEINIQNFVNFVGKQGTLANFYQRFLKPFVNDNGKTWQWLVIDDQKLPFSQDALLQIQEAMKLQNMSKYALFSLGQNHPSLQRFQLPEKLQGKA